MRIVFLGDSLTWGGYGGDFVAEVAARLPEHAILNAGVGGDTVINLLRRVDEIVVTMEQEAIKLVEVVQGDREVDFVEDSKP